MRDSAHADGDATNACDQMPDINREPLLPTPNRDPPPTTHCSIPKENPKNTNKMGGDRIAELLFTFAITAATVANVWVARRQWQSMQGQLGEMKQSFTVERAYVLNSKFERPIGASLKPGDQVTFWFYNFGKTPAIFRGVGASCEYSANGFKPIPANEKVTEFTDNSGLMPEGIVIPINEQVGPFKVTLNATKQEIDMAQTGGGKIYCKAIISYADIRDSLHETSICFFYDFSFSRFFLCTEKGANYHS